MRSNKDLNSKEYKTTYGFIHEVDLNLSKATDGEWRFTDPTFQKEEIAVDIIATDINENQELTKTVITSKNTLKYQIKDEIYNLEQNLARVNSAINKINSLKAEECLFCFCGCLAIIGGLASIESGVHDINDGNIGIGLLEEANGLLLLNAARNDFKNASMASHELSDAPSLSQLETVRNGLKEERTQLRKKLYEVEKNETLQVLDKQVEKQSPLSLAAKNQFDQIDTEIANGKFSKTYIDVAVNTRQIVTAKNQQMRNHYADKHVAMTTKQSISNIVCGCMLLFAGLALGFASCILGGLFFAAAGPLSIGGAIFGVLTSIVLVATGINLIMSGAGKKRSPLLTQSLFNVVDKAKTTEINTYQYGSFKYS